MKNKIFAIAFFCLVCVQHQVKGQFVGTPYIVPVTDVYSETLNYLNDLQTGAGLFTGRACFDVTQTNNTATCGNLTSRKAEPLSKTGGRADFTNTITYTQTYTFTPSGTVSNVRFYAVEATAYRGQIIQSITGGNTGNNITAAVTCTVVYKSDLNTKAAGKSTAAALTVDIYAVYNDGATKNGTDRQIKITAKIKDCACCPGLLIPGGTYLNTPPIESLPYAALDNNFDGSAIEVVRTHFVSIGIDLCFYYRDYSSTANTNISSLITWNNATNIGASLGYVCGASDGKGVDTEHANSAWRLPILMELAQIGQLVANSTTGGPSGTITQAMVNTAMSYTNGKLPSGSSIIASTVYNLRFHLYLSGTQVTTEQYSDAWSWSFSTGQNNVKMYSKDGNGYMRCVRSFY